MSKYSFNLNFVLAMDLFSLDCFVYAVSDWSLNVRCRNCKNEMEISVSLVSDLVRPVQSARGQKQSHIPLNLAGISKRYEIAWEEKKPPRPRSVVYGLSCYSRSAWFLWSSTALHCTKHSRPGYAAMLEVIVGQKWSSPLGQSSRCSFIYIYDLLVFYSLL